MNADLTAVPTPPAEAAGLADHVLGATVALAATVAGAIAMPLLALAWVALSPLLPFVLVVRAIGAAPQAEVAAAAAADRAAA